MSTQVGQDDLSFLLQRHAELEEKCGDGDGGRFLSGWQCENPWIEQIRILVDGHIRQIDSGHYLTLDSDPLVKEELYRFHRFVDGVTPDSRFSGAGASSIIFTFCAWLRQQDIHEVYYIPPLYFSLHFALRLLGIRARAISGKHAFEPGFSFNLPSQRTVLLFADPIWYVGIPLSNDIIQSLVEWQGRTGSLVFVDGSFQYAKWEGLQAELSALFDPECTARLICPTKALASHGYRFAYVLLPKAMYASLAHIYANIYGSASVDSLAFARIAPTTMAHGTILSSLMRLAAERHQSLRAQGKISASWQPSCGYFVFEQIARFVRCGRHRPGVLDAHIRGNSADPALSALPPKLTSARCGQMSAMCPQRTESSRGSAAYAVTRRSPDGGTFVPRRDLIGG